VKALVFSAVLALFVVLTPARAFASWPSVGAGQGFSGALLVGLPTNTIAAAGSATSIHVSWNAPAAPSATPSQYVVRRVAPTTATVCTVGSGTSACDDSGLTANSAYSYTVEARIGANWSSGQTTAFGTTTSIPTFIVTPAAGTQTAGTAFNVTLVATTNGVTTDTAFTGTHTITFSGPTNSLSGATPTYPPTVTFSAGVATVSITLVNATAAPLTATDPSRSGSASITVVAGAPSALAYSNSTPVCTTGTVVVGNGGTFTSNVSLLDNYGNTATASALTTIDLTKAPAATGTLAPTTLTIAAGASQSSTALTFKLPVGNPPAVTVTAASAGLSSTACIVRKS
jgi:hypothetical protein